MINLDELKAIPDPIERYLAAVAAFRGERLNASQRVRDILDAQGVTRRSVSLSLGIDPGGFHRLLTKGFTMPINSFTFLCYSFLSRSAQEIMLGIPAEVPLPRNLSAVVSAMQDPAKADFKEEICAEIQAFYSQAKANQEIYSPKMTAVESHDLVRLRILEYANDHYILPSNICGERQHISIRNATKHYLDEKSNNMSTIDSLLFIALESNIPIDYFICPMYANLCNIRLCDSEPGDIIRDKMILLFVVKYLQLRPNLQQEFLQIALSKLWQYPD